ncbi:DUF1592 domain-containing protein, partial [Bryobacter aggregatus]|uniref:DUF1592 domain-containing protein n=1 Tax=Bryobacter aggregatus TaxID=360054 RepID=UPI0004E19A14
MRQNCVGCHNDRLHSGGVNLAKFLTQAPSANRELAEKVLRQVELGLMPPTQNYAKKANIINGLRASLDSAPLSAGAPPLHRLNRSQYANSIRDLLGLEIDVSAMLPPDDLTRGFDNLADGLTISPTLVEALVRAAGKISRAALGDTSTGRQQSTYSIPRVISQTRHVEGTPFGTRGGTAVEHLFQVDGDYVFKLHFYFHQMGTTLFGRTLGKGQKIEVSIDGKRHALLDIDPAMKQFDELKTPPLWVSAGPHRIAAAFLKDFDGAVEDLISPVEQALVDVNVANIPGITALPHLHDLIIDGPLKAGGVSETPARQRILSCRPENESAELGCAKQILKQLAVKAYRRPIGEGDVDRLLSQFQAGRNNGGFEAGIQAGLQAILSNPEFLIRFEKGGLPGRNYRISDLELATRLSYFLWSSTPDEELISIASRGLLHEPKRLEAQVRRMLADPRADTLSTNFASQWLTLQNLTHALPDPLLFPNFDRNVAQSMRRETELLFDSIVREDRNLLDLLNADYTHVDERLAKHYGIPNILGNRFRRVPVTEDARRGLLGHGSILTLTSVANRTSPVLRGKWVLETILGTPPPPPPPNIPALKEVVENVRRQSVRERLEEHRANPACASCHRLMDPIGFALDNYDAVGLWRQKDLGFPLDTKSKFFDGTPVDGPVSLRAAILRHSDVFLENFAERLLSYGSGRVLTPKDMPVVRAIARDAALAGNRFSAFVMATVTSVPFQMRRDETNPKGD